MDMTFDQYIVNPMGVKNAVYSNKDLYRNLYTEKLDKILVRETGKVDYRLFKDDINDRYYVLMKVPSEVVPNFYYDTMIMFYSKEATAVHSKSLKSYNVNFYSNDPSFVYTFAHAFLKNQLFIRDLIPKMSRDAILKAAKERNPKNDIGYVKSIYFTYLLMTRENLFEKIKFITAEKYDKKKLLSDIVHADIKVRDRQEKGAEIFKKEKLEKAKNNVPIKRVLSDNISKVTSAMSKTSMVKSVNKAVNRVKKVSRIKNI